MEKKIISLGNELGSSMNKEGKRVYEIECHNEIIKLPKEIYNIWIAGRAADFNKQEIIDLLKITEGDFEKGMEVLQKQKAILYWPNIPSEDFFNKLIIIPKGRFKEVTVEQDYLIETLPRTHSVAISSFAFEIWRFAHPLFNLNTLAGEIQKVTNEPFEKVVFGILDWIPFLVGNGLVSLDYSLALFEA